MPNLKQSTATNRLIFMTDSTDHVSGKAGLTLVITASKAGGAFASITPTVTERGTGWYSLALTTSHTDTPGDLALHVTATGADPTDKLYDVTAGSLDADVSSRSTYAGGAFASVTAPVTLASTQAFNNTGQTTKYPATLAAADVTGNLPANVATWLASAPNALQSGRVDTYLGATAPSLAYDGIAQAGAASTITLASTASAVDNAYRNFMVRTVGGTGPGQGPFRITGYVGSTKVATVVGTFSPTPSADTQYVVDPPVAADLCQWLDVAPLALSSQLVQVSASVSLGSTAPAGWINTAAFASGATIPRVTLVDTVTTYSGNTPQTGDSFARLGATGSGLTSLAPASTALSTAVWTNTKAGFVDAAISGISGGSGGGASLAAIQGELNTRGLTSALSTTITTNLNATVGSRSTYAGGSVASVTAPVIVGTVNDKSGYSLSATGLDLVIVEAGYTMKGATKVILAFAGDKILNNGSTPVVVGGAGMPTPTTGASTRITATMSGNDRASTAIVLSTT